MVNGYFARDFNADTQVCEPSRTRSHACQSVHFPLNHPMSYLTAELCERMCMTSACLILTFVFGARSTGHWFTFAHSLQWLARRLRRHHMRPVATCAHIAHSLLRTGYWESVTGPSVALVFSCVFAV